jgi:excisionase family DNA binding protein
MDAAWLPVTLYLQTEVLTGVIRHSHEERLLDLLNSVFVRRPESRGKFLSLRNVTIEHTGDKEERLPTAYVNKSAIQVAAITDGDLARGVGARAGPKPYPFIRKSPSPVVLRTPNYELVGDMHLFGGQAVWHLFEEKLMFLPLTNVKISALGNGVRWSVGFVAVNREQIFCCNRRSLVDAKAERRKEDARPDEIIESKKSSEAMARRDEVVRLRETGLTYAEIGRRLGVSKQRVSQILKPKPKQKPKRSRPVVMLAIRDVSSLLGVHANTVRRWSDRGLIRAYRITSRGDRRFRREEVYRFLKEREIE